MLLIVDDIIKFDSADYDDTTKSFVISFLNKFKPSYVTSNPVIDRFTNRIVADADNIFSDGHYEWNATQIYEFEHYNLKLSDEFIQYVLKQ